MVRYHFFTIRPGSSGAISNQDSITNVGCNSVALMAVQVAVLDRVLGIAELMWCPDRRSDPVRSGE